MQAIFPIPPRLSPLCGARVGGGPRHAVQAFIGGESEEHSIIDMTRLVDTGTR
jgi:hypothetical protein